MIMLWWKLRISRYVTGIQAEADDVDCQLSLFSDTLEEWLTCQRNWMYLESIFSAPDIQRQLPSEAKAFHTIDTQFREIMKKTKERPNALKAATTPGICQCSSNDADGFCGCLSGRLEIFQSHNKMLEKIQKNLEDYLETKRIAFPRFYFLSNDELLEILAETKNVQAVQPHMGKCFDGIRKLEFGADPGSISILSMISGLFRYKGLLQCLQRTEYNRRGRNRVTREESEGERECGEMARRC